MRNVIILLGVFSSVQKGSSWRIHLSEATRDRLERAGGYYLEPRGPIEIKGKGLMNTYWLLGKQGFDKVLPTPPPIGLVKIFFVILHI